ncbi:hypothetical protein QTO34_005714 [Cnephaeus nilssonii]|uniref:Uncharacterized protein n=1 Tax=Cnephaeus nilssonii TaxID=3371016 RepID=A0AA40LH34_CNENI|nr:hypothetical protein QTO34_005714 [Eptesicus nilssonii]
MTVELARDRKASDLAQLPCRLASRRETEDGRGFPACSAHSDLALNFEKCDAALTGSEDLVSSESGIPTATREQSERREEAGGAAPKRGPRRLAQDPGFPRSPGFVQKVIWKDVRKDIQSN